MTPFLLSGRLMVVVAIGPPTWGSPIYGLLHAAAVRSMIGSGVVMEIGRKERGGDDIISK